MIKNIYRLMERYDKMRKFSGDIRFNVEDAKSITEIEEWLMGESSYILDKNDNPLPIEHGIKSMQGFFLRKMTYTFYLDVGLISSKYIETIVSMYSFPTLPDSKEAMQIVFRYCAILFEYMSIKDITTISDNYEKVIHHIGIRHTKQKCSGDGVYVGYFEHVHFNNKAGFDKYMITTCSDDTKVVLIDGECKVGSFSDPVFVSSLKWPKDKLSKEAPGTHYTLV